MSCSYLLRTQQTEPVLARVQCQPSHTSPSKHRCTHRDNNWSAPTTSPQRQPPPIKCFLWQFRYLSDQVGMLICDLTGLDVKRAYLQCFPLISCPADKRSAGYWGLYSATFLRFTTLCYVGLL
jgi:hypothetical protein